MSTTNQQKFFRFETPQVMIKNPLDDSASQVRNTEKGGQSQNASLVPNPLDDTPRPQYLQAPFESHRNNGQPSVNSIKNPLEENGSDISKLELPHPQSEDKSPFLIAESLNQSAGNNNSIFELSKTNNRGFQQQEKQEDQISFDKNLNESLVISRFKANQFEVIVVGDKQNHKNIPDHIQETVEPDFQLEIVKEMFQKFSIYQKPTEQLLTSKGDYFCGEQNNSVYSGEWFQHQRNGFGRQFNQDGSYFEGHWSKDKEHGQGVRIQNSGITYIGEFSDGLPHGVGETHYPDGSYHKGDYVKDKFSGNGHIVKLEYEYTGEFVNNLKHGHGEMRFANGDSYVGDFLRDKFNGKGDFLYFDGRKYQGDWVEGQMEGQGQFTFPNGRKYVGSYRQNKKHGDGKFWWANGEMYNGKWQDGLQNGFGTLIQKNGTKISGQWLNGEFIPTI